MRNLYIICISVNLFISSMSFGQTSSDEACASCSPAEKELLKTFEKARATVQGMVSSQQCGIDPTGSAKLCDFKDVCSSLSSFATQPVLYKNSKGQIIPNYTIQYSEYAIKNCLGQKHFEITGVKKSQTDFMSDASQGWKDHNIKSNQANKLFLQSVIQNHEEDIKMALDLAAVDVVIEKTDQKFEPTMKTPTREDHEKALVELEKKSGKKFSDKTRKLYLDYMTIAMDFSSMGEGPKKSPLEKAQDDVINQNPFINVDLFTSSKTAGGKEKVIANQASFQSELDRSFKVFQESKNSIIQLLKSRATPENKSEVDAMIARIDLIKMSNPEKEFMSCPGPNAFYNPGNHSFTLCPQVMQLPDASIKAIIAHELGHSIDPCTITSSLIQVDGQKNPAFDDSNKKDYFKETREKNGIIDLKLTLPSQALDNKDAMVDIFPEYNNQNRSKIYQNFTTKTLSSSIPIEKNPFASVISCLGSSKSIGAKPTSEKEIEKTIDEVIGQLKASGATDGSEKIKNLQKAKSNLPELVKTKGYCAGFLPTQGGGKSQFQEAFADWVAGEVLAKDLNGLSEKDKKIKTFESIGFFAGVGCASVQEAANAKVKDLVKQIGCDQKIDSDLQNLITISQANGRTSDEHPFEADRVNKVFFANPATQKAFGCKVDQGVKHCE